MDLDNLSDVLKLGFFILLFGISYVENLSDVLGLGFLILLWSIYYIATEISKFKRSKVLPKVVCVNCKKSLENPGENLCSHCGLDLYIVQKDSPKAISLSEKPILDYKEHTVTCVNCNFEVVNPTTNLCSNCGLDMLIKSLYKNCSNCGSDYENKLTECPICGAN